MLRRRFAPLGRMAAQVAIDVPPPAAEHERPALPLPTVYASRYGEAARSLELLAEHASGQPMSPTAFGLSVHNAVGAMISIVQADRSAGTALAAGRLTAAAGVTECLALLGDGAPAVRLVVYEAPLPPAYAGFADEPAAHFAWAWQLRRPLAGESALTIDWRGAPSTAADAADDADVDAVDLPESLRVLQFGLGGRARLAQRAAGHRVRWSRDG